MVVIGKWTRDTKKNRLKVLRMKYQLSQKDLGKLLQVAYNTILYWECGKYHIKEEYLIKLSAIFQVSIDYILMLTDESDFSELKVNEVKINIQNALIEVNAKGSQSSPKKEIPKNNIKELRRTKQLTQFELARVIGVSVYAVTNWELGCNAINAVNQAKLADFFGVPYDYIQLPVQEETSLIKSPCNHEVNQWDPKRNRLKMLRKQKKVTQITLSRELGIDINYLSYWERGLYYIDDESLAKLSEYFSVTPQYFLGIVD